jgi:transposase-like protein
MARKCPNCGRPMKIVGHDGFDHDVNGRGLYSRVKWWCTRCGDQWFDEVNNRWERNENKNSRAELKRDLDAG